MSEKFDTTGPHDHQCSNCYAEVYCNTVGCEIPQYSECLTCRRASSAVEHFDHGTNFFRNVSGYRKTWPGRFAVEHHTLPLRERRNRRGL